MWLAGLLTIFIFYSIGLAEAIPCDNVLKNCSTGHFPSCMEKKMRKCIRSRTRMPNTDLYMDIVNSSKAARVDTPYGHVIHIPSEALLRSSGMQPNTSGHDVNLTIFVLDNNLFQASSAEESVQNQVLGVWLGVQDVHNLSHPVRMVFKTSNQTGFERCVFWKQPEPTKQGLWSTEGCKIKCNCTHCVCSCNHLSFFAVLISPESVSEPDARRLENITYVGSSLSVLCTAITIMMFAFQSRKRKSEHSVIIHVQLAGSMLLLHFFFLISALWTGEEETVCRFLGLMLHWALLATFTWTAVEGFHLYLLIVRVFNIYIRRYLLKVCLVGWGIPIITVIICGVSGEYGKYTLAESTGNATDLCWIKTQTMSYVTVNGYLGLVLLFNATILVVMVGKMRQLRMKGVPKGPNKRRLWKDWCTILGLSWVLGLPWGLAFSTYGPLNLPGIYIFTILNSFQGVFMLLWFLSITCKSVQEKGSSSKNSKISMSNLSS